MREILFRGKRKDTGEWIEGNLIHKTSHYGDPLDEYHILYTGEFHCDYYDSAEVFPETVGQYIGLTDKNGMKIFEGDFLNGFEYPFISDTGEHNYFVEVVWFDNCPAFGLYTHKHPLSTVRGISEGNCDIIEDFDSSRWEVIGNIYDNPELLKGE